VNLGTAHAKLIPKGSDDDHARFIKAGLAGIVDQLGMTLVHKLAAKTLTKSNT